ncbi:MAG: carbamoyltransferase N-terminal domain-containing protein, partial [Candidatus Eremiobacterota bacterium]
MSKNILGISAYYHDSAAAVLINGEISAAAHEERFTRKKHDKSFPVEAIKFCLNYSGLSIDELDAVVFYDKPWLKFERLLETYYIFAPAGLKSFLSAIPVWIREKVFLKKIIKDELHRIEHYKKLNLLFSEHHMSHGGSAFYPSPFKEAAIVTIDGVGEWATASICHGKDNKITMLKELRFPHSLGLLYSAFTYYLGFKVNSGEYKLMGLSPYGDPASERVDNYVKLIYKELIDVKEDGSLWLNQEYFDYATGLKMTGDEKWQKLFGFKRRTEENELEQHHCDLSLAIQRVTDDIVLKMVSTAKKLTGSKYLCMSGGVALNCVTNGKILRKGLFEDIWIQPAAGDAGGALGAACAVYHMYFDRERSVDSSGDKMAGSYLGPEFSHIDIKLTARKFGAIYKYYENFDDLCSLVADYINDGKVVGWFQGRMEWGPRALGNRSILGDARNKEMQKRMNLKIKFREGFRPFAPSVMDEDKEEYFNIDRPSPYMLLIADVKENRRNPLPEDYHKLSVKDKLYYIRSDIPAITHLDYSARLQTVHKETNLRYWKVINAFKEKTGYGVIVNTSF